MLVLPESMASSMDSPRDGWLSFGKEDVPGH